MKSVKIKILYTHIPNDIYIAHYTWVFVLQFFPGSRIDFCMNNEIVTDLLY